MNGWLKRIKTCWMGMGETQVLIGWLKRIKACCIVVGERLVEEDYGLLDGGGRDTPV